MTVSWNNGKDIVANIFSIIEGNKTIDVLEAIDVVQGLAPETLKSLVEKVATTLNNDSNFLMQSAPQSATKRTRARLTVKLMLIVFSTKR